MLDQHVTYGVYYWLIGFQCAVVLDSCFLLSDDYRICYPSIPGIFPLPDRNLETVKSWLKVIHAVKILDISHNHGLGYASDTVVLESSNSD